MEPTSYPRRRVNLDAVVVHSPMDAAAPTDWLDRLGRTKHQQPAVVHVDLANINGQPLLAQLIHAVPQPLRVKLRADRGPVVGDPHHESATAWGIRQARELACQELGRLLILWSTWKDLTPLITATWLLLHVDIQQLDVSGSLPRR